MNIPLKMVGNGKSRLQSDSTSEEIIPLLSSTSFASQKACKDETEMKKRRCCTGSMYGITFTIINNAGGTGLLFVPFIFKEIGIVCGIFALLVGILLSRTSMEFVFRTSYKYRNNKNVTDYDSLTYQSFGLVGRLTAQLCVVFLCTGASVSYIGVVSDILLSWVDDSFYHALILILIVLPFVLISMLNKIGKLSYLSYVKFFLILVFGVMIIISYFVGYTTNSMVGVIKYWPTFEIETLYVSLLNMFNYFGIICASFAAHAIITPMVIENSKRSKKKMRRRINLACLIIFVMYCVIAEFGYLSFADGVTSDLIVDYHRNDVFSAIFKLIIGLSVLLTFTLVMFTGKSLLINFIKDMMLLILKKKGLFKAKSGKCKGMNIFNVATALLIGTTTIILAIVFPYAADVFSLVGTSFACLTMYVLPTLLFMKEFKHKWYCFLALALYLCSFVFVGIFGSIYNVVKIILEEFE